MRCTAQMFLLSEDAIAVVLKVPGHGRKGGGLYSADFALAAVQNQQPPDGTSPDYSEHIRFTELLRTGHAI